MGAKKKRELVEKKKEYMKTMYTSTKSQKFKKLPHYHHNAVTALIYMEKNRMGLEATLGKIAKGELTKRERVLVTWAVQYRKEIDYILQKTRLLQLCPHLRAEYVKILLAQVLYGAKRLPKGAKETAEIFYFEEDLMDAFVEANTVFKSTYIDECIPIYVRINTLSMPLEQCISAFCKEGWKLLESPKNYNDYLNLMYTLKEKEFIRDFHISELLVFPPGTSFYKHPGYLRGKFVIQDKGSCLASFLLNPKPGSRVLDIGAATGKTTNHIANIINNEGNVFAVEYHPHRYKKLVSFLELTNSKCVKPMNADVKQVSIENLDYILVDVSCTNSGVQYERTETGLNLKLRRSYYLNFKLLLYALQHFPTVKRVVYSARSIYPEEGEKVVNFALSVVGQGYELLDVKQLLWNEWYTFGNTETKCGKFPFASKCLRTNPYFEKCFGYFIAVFERNFEIPVAPYGFEKWEKPVVEGEDSEDEESDDDRYPKAQYKLVHGFPRRIHDPNSITKSPYDRRKPAIKIPCTNIPEKSALTWTRPQTSTSALLSTPQTCTSTSALLSKPQTSASTRVLLPTPGTSASTRVLLPTPGTSASSHVFMPTPQASTKTPVQFPMPQTASSNRVLLPTPTTSTLRNPALLSMPQSSSNNRVLLPTPTQVSSRNPVLLPTPQTSSTVNRMYGGSQFS